MITILEGVDGVGKTSHAHWLAKETNAKIIHAGIPTKNHWWNEYITSIMDEDEDQRLILDRWHIGEIIWPHIFGRKSLFERNTSFILCHNTLLELGAQIKIIYRNTDCITTTLMMRGEQDQIDNVLKAQDMYLDLADRVHGIEVVDSDTLGRDLPDVY